MINQNSDHACIYITEEKNYYYLTKTRYRGKVEVQW